MNLLEIPSTEEIFSVICNILLENGYASNTTEIHQQTRPVEDLALDSLGVLSLCVEIENHFRISLNEGEEERPPQTMAQLVALIQKRYLQQHCNPESVSVVSPCEF